MGESTKIEWCDATFNPWIGCAKVSEACKFCYAEHEAPVRIARDKAFYVVDGHSGMQVFKVGKKAAGRLLDGREWSQLPKVAGRDNENQKEQVK